MKNKKLFAILTLVCFMMTLMPVAAFAADGYTVQDAKVVVNTLENFVQVDATTGSVYSVSENGTLELVDTVPAEVSVAGKYVVISGTAPTTLPANAKTVTVTENDLNRVAADAAYDHSSIMTVERNVSTEKLTDVAIKLLVQNKYNDLVKTNELYVWATQGTSKVPATALLMEGANISPVTTGNEGNAKVVEGVYKVTGDIETTATGDEAFFVQFASAGTYTIHASFDAPTFENGKIADAKELTTADATKTIEVTAASVASKDYRAIVTLPAGHDYDLYEDVTEATPKDFVNGETVVKDGNILKTVYVEANNVAEEEIVLKLVARDGVSALPYKDLKISTAGAVEVSDETVTTDHLLHILCRYLHGYRKF